MEAMTLFAVPDLPLVKPGDDIAALIVQQLHAHGEALQPGDIVVIAQKIVSKAEGRLVKLADIQAGAEAKEMAALVDKDERVVQAILDDSRAVIRASTRAVGGGTKRRLGLRQRRRGSQQCGTRPRGFPRAWGYALFVAGRR